MCEWMNEWMSATMNETARCLIHTQPEVYILLAVQSKLGQRGFPILWNFTTIIHVAATGQAGGLTWKITADFTHRGLSVLCSHNTESIRRRDWWIKKRRSQSDHLFLRNAFNTRNVGGGGKKRGQFGPDIRKYSSLACVINYMENCISFAKMQHCRQITWSDS